MTQQQIILTCAGVAVPVRRQLANPMTYRHAVRSVGTGQVRLICLHSAECSEVATAAEALASWAQGESGPKTASWHFACDSDSITQSVPEEAIAWHAGRVNPESIGIEIAGRASQTAAQWADPYSAATLEQVALLMAYLSQRWEIPVVPLTDAELLSGARGVTTHRQVTRAYGVRGGHTDPGEHFPLEAVCARALRLGGRET